MSSQLGFIGSDKKAKASRSGGRKGKDGDRRKHGRSGGCGPCKKQRRDEDDEESHRGDSDYDDHDGGSDHDDHGDDGGSDHGDDGGSDHGNDGDEKKQGCSCTTVEVRQPIKIEGPPNATCATVPCPAYCDDFKQECPGQPKCCKKGDDCDCCNVRDPQKKIAFKLTSSAFDDGDAIPAEFTCEVKDAPNPPLAWSGAPPRTACLVLVVDDPSAIHDTGSVFVHWNVIGIPAATNGAIASPAVFPPEVVQLQNDNGFAGYFGPCPPADGCVHTYRFTLYALSACPVIAADAENFTKEQFEKTYRDLILGCAILRGKFSIASIPLIEL